jgi:hypothetical protein
MRILFSVIVILITLSLKAQVYYDAHFTDGHFERLKVVRNHYSEAPAFYLGGSVGLNLFTPFHDVIDPGFSVYSSYRSKKVGLFAEFSKPFNSKSDLPYTSNSSLVSNSAIASVPPVQYYVIEGAFSYYFSSREKEDSVSLKIKESATSTATSSLVRLIYIAKIPGTILVQKGIRIGYRGFQQSINRFINPESYYLSSSGKYRDTLVGTNYSAPTFYLGYTKRRITCVEIEKGNGTKKKISGEVTYYADVMYCPKISVEGIYVPNLNKTIDVSPTFVSRNFGFKVGFISRYLYNKSEHVSQGFGLEFGMRPDLVKNDKGLNLKTESGLKVSPVYFTLRYYVLFSH